MGAVDVDPVHEKREDHGVLGVLRALEAVAREGADAVQRSGLCVAAATRRGAAHPARELGSTSSIESSSFTTEAGDALLRRVSPDPFSPVKRAPCLAANPRTTEMPAAVEPLSPNSAPTSLSSISAR